MGLTLIEEGVRLTTRYRPAVRKGCFESSREDKVEARKWCMEHAWTSKKIKWAEAREFKCVVCGAMEKRYLIEKEVDKKAILICEQCERKIFTKGVACWICQNLKVSYNKEFEAKCFESKAKKRKFGCIHYKEIGEAEYCFRMELYRKALRNAEAKKREEGV